MERTFAEIGSSFQRERLSFVLKMLNLSLHTYMYCRSDLNSRRIYIEREKSSSSSTRVL